MKVILAAAVTAALLAGAAIAGNTSPSPTKAQFAALTKRVATLEKSNDALNSYVTTCLHGLVGVAEYGGNDATTGYAFDITGQPPIDTTALDITSTGDVSDYAVLKWVPSCAGKAVSAARLYSYQRP